MAPFFFQRESGDRKRKYWYIAENQRINGKMVRIWEKYIGTTERMIEIFKTGAIIPNDIKIINFGLIAAILNLSEELGFVEIINRYTPKRNQGLSIGEFNLLSILNRCDEPTSKNDFQKWYDRTFLSNVYGKLPEKLNTQNFSNHMKPIDDERIRCIEEELCKQLIAGEYINETNMLFLYDPTNIFTFIDFFEEPDEKGKRLPQMGQNKAKRFDLRQINIALMVTKDFGIPVMHSTYEGNINDVTKFKTIINTIIERTMIFIKNCEKIILVFDKGNNCQEAMDKIEDSPLKFVGSLKPSTQQDLFDIPLNEFEDTIIDENGEVITRSYRLKREVFGKEYTLVITFDSNTFKRSLLSFLINLEKRENELQIFIQEKLNKNKWINKLVVRKKVDKILNTGKPKDIYKINVKKHKGSIIIEYHIDLDVLYDHIKCYGKTIHFTDNDDWSDEQIINTYRGKNLIESQIKSMKDPYTIDLSPVRYWTDEMIRVHIFHCIMALMFLSVLKKKLHMNGMDMSTKKIVNNLKDIKQIEFKVPKKGTATRKIVTMNKTQKRMYEILNLQKYDI